MGQTVACSMKPRKIYLTAGSAFCVFYAFQITFRALVRIDRKCVGVSIRYKHTSHRIESVLRSTKRRKPFALNLDKVDQQNDIFVSVLNRTDYFSCGDFDKLPNTTQAISENKIGNRGISFMKVRIEGIVVSAVFKQANKYPKGQQWNTFAEQYKFNTAKREIEFLNELQGLPGIPRLFGFCIANTTARYLVERIYGSTLCNDNGTTVNCSKAGYLVKSVIGSSNPKLAALRLAYTTTRLFRLLEERQLFYEDLSGVNLMFTSQFEVFMVDLDSLVHYNQRRLTSKLRCTSDDHCSGPVGNLWVERSLNARIYTKCFDFKGFCQDGRCRGFDTALHACGIADWYICKLTKIFQDMPKISEEYHAVCKCMQEPDPKLRCSFAAAMTKLKGLLLSYAPNDHFINAG